MTKKPMDLDEIRERLAGARGPRYWRSLEEIAATEEFQDYLRHEFPENADQWGSSLSRRRFLQLMSASFALAGLTACARQPVEKIVPYVDQPEPIVPGKPLYYATALPWRGYAMGVLAESHMGRPTKIEGNPDHPASLGASDAFMQASLLTLYDPDRSQAVVNTGTVTTWEAFVTAITSALAEQKIRSGAGLRILTGTVTSPSMAAAIDAVLALYPDAKWHQWEPASRDAVREGARAAFGTDAAFSYRLDRARVILSLDDDFLSAGPASVRYARDFTSQRRIRAGRPESNRLYAVESSPGLAGAVADHRLPLRAGRVEDFARAVARELGLATAPAGDLPPAAHELAVAAARDLAANRGAGLVTAGEGQPAAVHGLAHSINHALGNAGSTVVYTDPVEARPVGQIDSLRELVGDMDRGAVDLLVLFGGNPVFDAPADLRFVERLRKVRMAVHLAMYEDETSEWCHWHVPMAHPLEMWGDGRAFEGTVTITQPLIAPLYNGKSPLELLSALAGQPERTSHDLVKDFWKTRHPGADFEQFWKTSLHDGAVAGTALPEKTLGAPALPPAAAPTAPAGALEAVFRPDPTIWDGELANNGWMQELPKPMTHLTWDNAAIMSPATAARLGLSNEDRVELTLRGRTAPAAVWTLPGHAEDSVTLHYGYGRSRVGAVGRGAGFDFYRLRASAAPFTDQGLEVRRTGGRYRLATTQHHNSIEVTVPDGSRSPLLRQERHDLIRTATLAEFRNRPDFAREAEETPPPGLTLYPAVPAEGYQWGMAIDLNSCIGCNACVTACQAENNIPIVGKDQVLRGREMHWIRIDRYFSGGLENPKTYHQPVMCMHCENAPCELVCPVGATVHSTEGLNEMIYNRCVGTRYCANNCPYKVRRFNFLQYNDTKSPTLKMLRNPNVSVRMRGVMEKCSYCIQRISVARIRSEEENRRIRDAEVRTACQQACPAQAITFGDITDAKSAVSRERADPLNYGILTSLNTRPRTSYLAKVWNPNPDLEKA